MSDPAPTLNPAAKQLLSLATRTLWALYLTFWLPIVIYAGILIAASTISTPAPVEGSAALQRLPQNWGEWQFLFAAAGLVCIYLTQRLGYVLLRSERFWQGARNLEELATLLDQKRINSEQGPSQEMAANAGPEGGEPVAADEEKHHRSLTGAVQRLLGKLVMAHLILWLIAEVPAVLGLIDRFLSGGHQLFLGLIILSALALAGQRPSRGRIHEILRPMFVLAGPHTRTPAGSDTTAPDGSTTTP